MKLIAVAAVTVVPLILSALTLAFPSLLVASDRDNGPLPTPAVSLSSIHIPEGMKDESIGLFFMSRVGDGVKYTKATTDEVKDIYDPKKPLVIFIHGMQKDDGHKGNESFMWGAPFIDAGFNTAVFYWSQLSDAVAPNVLEEALWGTDGRYGVSWRKADGTREVNDVPDVSIAEIFAAYYLDFMNEYGFSGNEIRFMGHSMGGPLTTAAVSYLMTKEKEKMIPAAYLPDRVTLFDPYFSQGIYGVTVSWLNVKMNAPLYDDAGNIVRKDTSHIEFAAEVAKTMAKRGISLEVIPSVTGIVPFMAVQTRGREGIDAFYSQSALLQFRTDWVVDPFITDFNASHSAGRSWYADSLFMPVYKDHAMANTEEQIISATTPLSYLMGRRGVMYEMDKNYTLDGGDDRIYSTNIDAPYVGGFCFFDYDKNGAYNERLQARAAGVKVELYLKSGAEDRLIGSAVTDGTGYYKIKVPAIYANGFDTLYVRAHLNGKLSNTIITVRADKINMMNNDINPDSYCSDLFIMAHRKTLQVINVGIKER